MKGLSTIAPVLDAPSLKDVDLIGKVGLSPGDSVLIRDHPSIERFGWASLDVPAKIWRPVVDTVRKPSPRPMRPEDWLE